MQPHGMFIFYKLPAPCVRCCLELPCKLLSSKCFYFILFYFCRRQKRENWDGRGGKDFFLLLWALQTTVKLLVARGLREVFGVEFAAGQTIFFMNNWRPSLGRKRVCQSWTPENTNSKLFLFCPDPPKNSFCMGMDMCVCVGGRPLKRYLVPGKKKAEKNTLEYW